MFMFSFMLWDVDQGCWMHYIQHYCDEQMRMFRPLSPSIAKIVVALKLTIRLQVLYQFLRDSLRPTFFKDIIPNHPSCPCYTGSGTDKFSTSFQILITYNNTCKNMSS